MLRIRNILFGLAALSVTACGPMDVVTRSAPFESTMPGVPAVETAAPVITEVPEIVSRSAPVLTAPASLPEYQVVAIRVDVPRSLRVSEANTLIPLGDIVWRGDLPGDRHEQVRTIMQNAFEQGVSTMGGSHEVALHIEVTRFHSLSQRARYSVGGNHTIHFNLTVIDANTGAVLEDARMVNATFGAYGGYQAIAAENAGLTQKVRITDHLANVIKNELDNSADTQMASAADF